MKRPLIATFLALTASLLFAQDIVVAYADGVLEVRNGARWSELFIGDFVAQDAEIRLGEDSYAELASSDTTVKISRSGEYRVNELIELTSRTQTAGVGSFLMNQVNRLSRQNRPDEQTSAGGARASEAATGPGTTWQGGGSTASLILDGIELLENGDIEEAYYVFEEAYDFAITDQQYQEALFYYGYASSLFDRTAQAIELLTEIGPDPASDYYVSHILVLGQLLMESVAYGEAVAYLENVATDNQLTPQERQSVQLMLGLSYAGLGQTGNARASLVRARDLIPESDAALAAQRVLEDL